MWTRKRNRKPPSRKFRAAPAAGSAGRRDHWPDLSRELTREDFSRIHQAHLDHHLLVFRDQRITPRQHIDFSRRFGPLMIHVLHQFHLPGHPRS